MREKKTKRFRKFILQRNFQYETHDENGNLKSEITELQWREKVVSEFRYLFNSGVAEILYAFHDQDTNADGTSKGLHVHAVVTYTDAKTLTAVVKHLGASSVHNCEHCASYCDAVRYLTHDTEESINDMKHRYSLGIVHGWRKEGAVIRDLTLEDVMRARVRATPKKDKHKQKKVRDFCMNAVMDGSAVISDVRDCYVQDKESVGLSSVDFLTDRRILREASTEWLARVTEFYQSHLCPLTTIYISGGGGTGKTTLANAIANSVADVHGVHKVAAPGRSTTFDFAGDYKGERVSIFNELAPVFPVEQFLSIFDPLNAMPVNSRHNDKLYFANYAIFTTSVNVESFIYDLWKTYAQDAAKIPTGIRKGLMRDDSSTERDWLLAYMKYLPVGDDKILQIRRRIPILIEIVSGSARISILNKKNNTADSYAFYCPQPDLYPYYQVNILPYDVSDLDHIDDQTAEVVKAVKMAVDTYYKFNGYKHPDEFEVPNFADSRKEENEPKGARDTAGVSSE